MKNYTKAQKNKIALSLIRFGKDACVLAHDLKVGWGRGSDTIELETGIPARNQNSAILAGEAVINYSPTALTFIPLFQNKKTEFAQALDTNIRSAVASLKREGTTNMSRDNLRQVTRPPSLFLAGAPRNRSEYELHFAVAVNTCPAFKKFASM